MKKRLNRYVLFLLVFWGAAVLPASTLANGNQFQQNEVIAVFLFNFAHFVTWPEHSFASSDSPIRYCTMKGNAVAAPLMKVIDGERVGPHPLAFTQISGADELNACHVVFVSESDREKLDAIFLGLNGQSVLTVSDVEDFVSEGAMIALTSTGKRLRPIINPRAVSEAGLIMSSKLLQISIIRDR